MGLLLVLSKNVFNIVTSNIFKGVLHSYFECKINILEICIHVRVFAKNTSTSQKRKKKKKKKISLVFVVLKWTFSPAFS